MARLKIAAFAGLGILLAIALLPQTRWILINDLASIREDTGSFYGCLDPRKWPDTPENAKARAVLLEEVLANPNSEELKLQYLTAYCRQNPDDASAWAHLIRMGCKMPIYAPDEPQANLKPTAAVLETRKAREAIVQEAIQNGARLDPKNCFFPLMRSVLLLSQGKTAESRRQLKLASSLPEFRDYTNEEGGLAYQAAVRSCGYRGAGMQVAAEAGVSYPQFIWLTRVPYIQRNGGQAPDKEAQLAAMRLSHRIAGRAQVGITVLVMKSVFERCLTNTQTTRSSKPKQREDYEAAMTDAAVKMDGELGSEEVSGMLKDFRQVDFDRYLNHSTSTEFSSFIENVGRLSVYSLFPLVGMVLAVPVVWLARGWSRLKMWLFRNKEIREAPVLWVIWTLVAVIGVVVVLYADFFARPGFMSTVGGPPADTPDRYTYLGVGATFIAAAVLFLPRRGDRPGSALAVALALFPGVYLAHAVVELRQDQALKRLVAELPKEADTIRGDWR